MEHVRPDSQQPEPVMTPASIDDLPMGVVSLPLHELNQQGEAPGPMSILEWRRVVWFEVQSMQDQSYPIVRPWPNLDNSYFLSHLVDIHHKLSIMRTIFPSPPHKNQQTQPSCHRSPSRISKDTSTDSDSVEELTDKPSIGRPSRAGSRLYPVKRPILMPLIDLSQPTDADGRPIQFEGGRARLVSQSNKPKKRMMAAPDIEQRHREAMRRLQAEATEHLIYAEWEASHQRPAPQSSQPKLQRVPSRQAPLRRLSNFARKSVSNLSVRTTTGGGSPSRTLGSGSNTIDKSRSHSALKTPESNKQKNPTRFTQLIKKFGSLRRAPSSPKIFSPDSEASMSRKSLLSSFRFSASTSAFHQ
ncbi:hypothetical protein MJO28_007079 [Puccinia striiformis f. sp. tritici]|uniref:Uncharacterized protein n=3 Tax=Puccinia striiformis TaxID=27350 RepID=A0A2S4WEN4_9BASI|nr:hypothetical protein MJO28_007079 [Puccinia striiformis f. sp. tritici]KAI7955634.1 hypothetical protein MJO29_007033 [Puccinia striiformis f. sp. tritici]POV97993.1 hypothetical protein PSTT_14723 [Puccinia striiformis]POW20199.1 hypothetical protein PSHT_03796 [Puccinia striiformis]